MITIVRIAHCVIAPRIAALQRDGHRSYARHLPPKGWGTLSVVTETELKRRGPAARARAEGRSYGVRLLPYPMTVRVDAHGQPRTPISPFGAIMDACRVCPARCCRYQVTVSLPDALRFCRTLGVPLFAGLTIVPSDHDAHAFCLDPDPRWRFEGSWPGRAELALKRRADGRCHALVDVGGYPRCGVYAARPSLCRTYPVRWTSAVAEGGPPTIHCPVPYGIRDDEADQLEQDIEAQIDAWELHDDVVAAWNDRDDPKTIEAFISFAIPLTASMLGVQVPEVLAPGTPEEQLREAMNRTRYANQPGPAITTTFAGLPIVAAHVREDET